MNIMPGNDNMKVEFDVHRGEIRYISNTQVTGSEQQGGRPVVIVSNEKCNEYGPFVTVVSITSKEKPPLPTHVKLNDDDLPVYGTILCESISQVSKFRLGNYIGEVSQTTMRQIEQAMAIQLDIPIKTPQLIVKNDNPAVVEKFAEKVVDAPVKNDELIKELKRTKLALIKAQERERVFRELYEETIRKGDNK